MRKRGERPHLIRRPLPLPGPDLHWPEHASFAWRTDTYILQQPLGNRYRVPLSPFYLPLSPCYLPEQYEAGYYLYLAAMRSPLPYSEHNFINLTWALESLHKKKQGSVGVDAPAALERRTRIQSIREKLDVANDAADRQWFEDRALDYQRNPALADRIFDSLSTLPIALDEKALRSFSMRCAERRNAISHEGGPREHETYQEFFRDVSNLNDALSYLYHALLLYEIGLDRELLIRAMTEGGLAEMRILPALLRVGLGIPRPVRPQ